MGTTSPSLANSVLSVDSETEYHTMNGIHTSRLAILTAGPLCQCFVMLITLASMAWIVFEFRDSMYYILMWVEKQDTWVICLMFAALFTFVSLPLTWGYILLNLACGYLFGILAGIIVVVVTAAIGVFIAHLIVKHLCLSLIVSKIIMSHNLRAFVYVISGPQAFKVVAFARLTPIPFGLQNAIFAASSIRLDCYMLATALGLLPTQVINVYLGSTLRSMQDVLTDDKTATTGYIVFSIQILISIGLMTYVVRRARRELEKIVQLTANDLHTLELCPSTDLSSPC